MLPSLLLSNTVARNMGEGGMAYVTLEDWVGKGLSGLGLDLLGLLAWYPTWPFCSNAL